MRQLSLAVIVSTLAVVAAACASEEDAGGDGGTGGSSGSDAASTTGGTGSDTSGAGGTSSQAGGTGGTNETGGQAGTVGGAAAGGEPAGGSGGAGGARVGGSAGQGGEPLGGAAGTVAAAGAAGEAASGTAGAAQAAGFGGEAGRVGAGATGGRGNGGSAGTGGRDLPLDCNTGNDCVIAHNSCCGYDCGQPDLDDFVVMRADALSDYRAEMCADHDPENCPNCPGYAQANFVSVCRSETCQGVDVRVDELSDCETEADCSLRWSGDCCEDCEGDATGGSGEYLIAIGDPSTFRAHVCEDVPGCPPCFDVTYPAGARADCVDGHCAVIQE